MIFFTLKMMNDFWTARWTECRRLFNEMWQNGACAECSYGRPSPGRRGSSPSFVLSLGTEASLSVATVLVSVNFQFLLGHLPTALMQRTHRLWFTLGMAPPGKRRVEKNLVGDALGTRLPLMEWQRNYTSSQHVTIIHLLDSYTIDVQHTDTPVGKFRTGSMARRR